ncbi:hypothetical protein ASZ78_012481 [Callipepla squamata]|uniref:Uncharacterized protein n=1 Tax=Callipepla squamata TaxID=9009 RepID=A0A226MW52_CALSU|nr:hypothetical protein ASZ78_012481 [Callipepla squamata]
MKTCLKGKEQKERQLQQQVCSLFLFHTKDIPVQSERLNYHPPLFLSPCVNYGSCGLVLHYQDPRVHPVSRRAQEQQQHSPDYQWYAPDQFPPDVQHKANGKTTAVLFFKMGAFKGFIANFSVYLLSAYMTDLPQFVLTERSPSLTTSDLEKHRPKSTS